MQQSSYVPVQSDAESHADSGFIFDGATLLDLMKHNVTAPQRFNDISGLALDKIALLPDGSVRIGALTRNSEMADHAQIKQRYPMLSEALLSGASVQLRNVATLAGNILQRT